MTTHFGIIGCGRMGHLHTERLHRDGRGRVTALFDEEGEAAERLQKELAPETSLCTSLESLLETEALDAVVICTPTRFHFDQVTAARNRGLHVLCEKPLADRREQIEQLIAETNRGGGLLSVAYQRRHWGTYRTLRREVQSGRWGPVRAVTSHTVENWQQTIAGTWREDPELNVGGFIGDAGSHKIDTIFYVTGLKPIDIFARPDCQGSRVEITATASARLEGDVPLAIDFIGNAQYLGEDLHIHCAEADLMIRDNRLWIGREGRVELFESVDEDSDPDVGFLDLLLDGEENQAPAECALPVFNFTQALLESGRRGCLVPVG